MVQNSLVKSRSMLQAIHTQDITFQKLALNNSKLSNEITKSYVNIVALNNAFKELNEKVAQNGTLYP